MIRLHRSHVAFAVTDPLEDDRTPENAAEPIIVEAFALPWNTPVVANSFGDVIEFEPGSVAVDDAVAGRVKFLREHDVSSAFGYGVGFTDNGAGLVARMAIPREELDDPETKRAVRQMANGVRDAVSVGVDLVEFTDEPLDPGSRDGRLRLTVQRAQLVELSSAILPRFDEARLTSIAASRTTTTTPEASQMDLKSDPTTDPTTDPETERLQNHRRNAGVTAVREPEFASFGAFARAVAEGDRDAARRYGFALTDLTTTTAAGVVPPIWVTDFAEELAAARPFVEAFETRPLPDKGMTVSYPTKTVTGPLVAAQAAQKTEVESGTVAIATSTANVATYAGGNDVSLQAILRTDPDYLSLLFEEYGYDLADKHNVAVQTAALAAIGVGNELALSLAAPETIVAKLAEGAKIVWEARRGARPDTFVLGTDVWEYFAGAADADGRPLFPGMSGANPVGTITITTQDGEARGLRYIVDPTLTATKAVLGWRRAITTWLGPIGTMSADVPSLLGRDVAIYQFAATAIRRADALVEYTLGA